LPSFLSLSFKGFALACVLVFMLAVLYEWSKVFRRDLDVYIVKKLAATTPANGGHAGDDVPLLLCVFRRGDLFFERGGASTLHSLSKV
jgi:hypothetical protein